MMSENPDLVKGFVKGIIRTYRFMDMEYPKTRSITERVLKFEGEKDMSLWANKYTLIALISPD
jgi:hypothetical protein